jgi:hypothetical protein
VAKPKAKRRVVCHSYFAHVRDSRARAVEMGLKPTLIKYNMRKGEFCFAYRPGTPKGSAGQKYPGSW